MQLLMGFFSVLPMVFKKKSQNMTNVSSDFTSIVIFCYPINVRVKPTSRHGGGISTIPNHEEHFFSRALMIERHIVTGPSNFGKQGEQIAFPPFRFGRAKDFIPIVYPFSYLHGKKDHIA